MLSVREYVVPAQAGVILRSGKQKRRGLSCFRASGGDPRRGMGHRGCDQLFPRKRG